MIEHHTHDSLDHLTMLHRLELARDAGAVVDFLGGIDAHPPRPHGRDEDDELLRDCRREEVGHLSPVERRAMKSIQDREAREVARTLRAAEDASPKSA